MKNFTLITLAAAFAAGFCQDASADGLPTVFKTVRPGICPRLKAETKVDATRRFAAKAADAGALWRAQTQKSYGWDGEDWDLVETYTISYDEKGQMTEQTMTDGEGYFNRETYTWNENGQLATRFTEVDEEGTGVFVDYSRLKREYDSRLISFITLNEQEIFNDGSWMPSNNYKQTITRDDAGNITLMERAVLFQGIYDPTYRINITYGENGQASTVVESDLTYDYFTGEYAWMESNKYTDIVWVQTDGQIVSMEDNYTGANKIKSATIESEGEILHLEVEYTGDGFVATLSSEEDEDGMVQKSSMTYMELDFSAGVPEHLNHGCKIKITNELLIGEEVIDSEVTTETYIYTAEDLVILEKVEYGEGEYTEIDSMTEGVVEYDEENGYPLSWTVSEYDWEMDEMVPTFRAEYSDYTDCSPCAVKDAMTANTPGTVYYNLQGQKVQNPANGIFIKVEGGKAGKVMIR